MVDYVGRTEALTTLVSVVKPNIRHIKLNGVLIRS
jgi:hypothetical protein